MAQGHNFYPRSPCGERPIDDHRTNIDLTFLSTLSLRRATSFRVFYWLKVTISIHALLAESDPRGRSVLLNTPISIHALLAESDTKHSTNSKNRKYFYPRSPCGERHPAEHHANSQQEFLSTLSLRRATAAMGNPTFEIAYFYPRSPCGERLRGCPASSRRPYFYPRSPCGERHVACGDWHELRDFYPRSPCGERPELDTLANNPPFISIHALLAESDQYALKGV